jgi:hypothetical protein
VLVRLTRECDLIRRAFHTFHVSIHPVASKVQALRHTVTTELRKRSVALAEVAGLLNIGRGCALNRMHGVRYCGTRATRLLLFRTN